MLIAFGSVYDPQPIDAPASVQGSALVRISGEGTLLSLDSTISASGKVQISGASNNILMVDPDKVLTQ